MGMDSRASKGNAQDDCSSSEDNLEGKSSLDSSSTK